MGSVWGERFEWSWGRDDFAESFRLLSGITHTVFIKFDQIDGIFALLGGMADHNMNLIIINAAKSMELIFLSLKFRTSMVLRLPCCPKASVCCTLSLCLLLKGRNEWRQSKFHPVWFFCMVYEKKKVKSRWKRQRCLQSQRIGIANLGYLTGCVPFFQLKLPQLTETESEHFTCQDIVIS